MITDPDSKSLCMATRTAKDGLLEALNPTTGEWLSVKSLNSLGFTVVDKEQHIVRQPIAEQPKDEPLITNEDYEKAYALEVSKVNEKMHKADEMRKANELDYRVKPQPDQKSAPAKDLLAFQVGGDHYKSLPIQPVEFCQRNKLGFIEGNVIKYIVRHSKSGKSQDIDKAIHYLQILKKLEYPDAK